MDVGRARDAAADVLFADGLNGVMHVQQNNLRRLLRCCVRHSAEKQYCGTDEKKDRAAPKCHHWTFCPRCSRACFMPRAFALAGSSWRAWLTSPAAEVNWFACRSIRASTRCAATFGCNWRDFCDSWRAASRSLLRSRTWASPAWAAAEDGSAARAA